MSLELELGAYVKINSKKGEYVHGWKIPIGWMIFNGMDEIWMLENSRGWTCPNSIFNKQCFTTFNFLKFL
jgi:hypothetical protein